jgi:hypothetical protein
LTAANRLSGEMFGKTPSLVVLKAKNGQKKNLCFPKTHITHYHAASRS